MQFKTLVTSSHGASESDHQRDGEEPSDRGLCYSHGQLQIES